MKVIMEERTLEFEVMTEEQFYNFCAKNPDQPMERDKHGNILIMDFVTFEIGILEAIVLGEVHSWNINTDAGVIFSSRTGFTLSNGAVRSPDAAWICNARITVLPEKKKQTFAHICPDFVIEIRSKSDRIQPLKEKMEEYRENGAKLGFLIDPYEQQAFVYKEDGSVAVADFNGVLSGDDVLPGFELPLSLFVTK